MDHGEKAKRLFLEGYNCAQAVLCAFEDEIGQDRTLLAKMASSFGGGMGRLREVCGAVSGALMAIGLIRGYSDPKDFDGKKEQYAFVQEFARRFREQNGSIVCRELLSGVAVKEGTEPEKRTDDYYKKRPCPDLIYCAAHIAEEMLML